MRTGSGTFTIDCPFWTDPDSKILCWRWGLRQSSISSDCIINQATNISPFVVSEA